MFLDKLVGLLLSQRFWVLLLGLVSAIGHDLLGFEEIGDVEALAFSILLIVGFILSYGNRQPANPGE